MTDDERHERGLATIREVIGPTGQEVIDRLTAVSPEMADHLVRFAFGDVLSRPALGHRGREIATVAALTAMGTAPSQLEVRLHAALLVGCTRGEIIVQMAVYAGFPAALNALFAAEGVFAEVDRDDA